MDLMKHFNICILKRIGYLFQKLIWQTINWDNKFLVKNTALALAIMNVCFNLNKYLLI